MHLKTNYLPKLVSAFRPFSGRRRSAIKAVRTASNSVPKVKQASLSFYEANPAYTGVRPKTATKTRFYLRKFIGTLNAPWMPTIQYPELDSLPLCSRTSRCVQRFVFYFRDESWRRAELWTIKKVVVHVISSLQLRHGTFCQPAKLRLILLQAPPRVCLIHEPSRHSAVRQG